MILISGCPRSGTSLMMDIMKTVFGKERVLGKKFPQEDALERIGVQQKGETDNQFKIRQYIEEKRGLKKTLEKELVEIRDMNPNGFWEMLYTVQGCHYRFYDRKRLARIKQAEKPFICKVVSQGLTSTDPQFVDKIVFMLRSPRAVAKSQERLKRSFPFNKESGLILHTPEMFISVTYSAAKWLNEYPDIPVKIVVFDDLITNKDKVLDDLEDFLGEGNWAAARDCIEPQLRRSEPEAREDDIWVEAEDLYALMLKADYKGVMDYMENKAKASKKQCSRQMYCTRLGGYMAYSECCECHSSDNFIRNKIDQAERDNIDWQNEPCLFECGYDMSREEYISIEDSIKNNHWLTVSRNSANSSSVSQAQELTITDLYEDIYR